jgi:GNAT superfamily N-acetyltransferase
MIDDSAPSDPRLTDAAAIACVRAYALLATAQTDGQAVRTGSTTRLVTGVPMALLNGVFHTDVPADPQAVAAQIRSESFGGLPWSIQVRGRATDPLLEKEAAEHGLGQRHDITFMTRDLSDEDAAFRPDDGVVVRPVTGTESAMFLRLVAAGFEAPQEIFARFATPAVLDHPAMHAYVTEVDGVPVASSFGVHLDGLVGVFNIAVPPEHRRRGYARTATAAVLRAARIDGARAAYLHPTPAGLPVYLAMGFRTAEHWTAFSR